jgi:hypothetical protein
LGDPIALELRGVIGFSDVILKLICTYDADLSESIAAERHVIERITPIPKKTQFAKAERIDARIASLVYHGGLPRPSITPRFVALLKKHRLVPAFW